MKFVIIIGTIFLLLASLANAEIITIEENTFNITPILNTSSCDNTDKVFLIERENYETGMNEVEINYQQKWGEQKVNISKTLKKYTMVKTGLIKNITTGNHSLQFVNGNKTLIWNIKINCSNINLSINQTINSTINNSINITINNSANITTNNSTNITLNESNNETTNINITNTNESEENETNVEKINLSINKYFFTVGEKLEFKFVSNTKPITYWIEDTKGNIVKDKYTTSNDNMKTYTFKEQEKEDKIYILKIEKEELKKEIILGVYKENKEKSTIKISEEKWLGNYIKATITAYRGNTLKSTITCNTITNNKKSSEEIKLKILDKNSEIKSTLIFFPSNKWDEKTIIKCEGLDLDVKLEIETKTEAKEIKGEILNTYTREKYYDENISWNVRAICEEEGTIIVESQNEKQEKTIEQNKEKTIVFEMNEIKAKDKILTTLLCGDKVYEQNDEINLKIKEEPEEKTTSTIDNKNNNENNNENKTIEKEVPVITGTISANSKDSKNEKTISTITLISLLLITIGAFIGYGPKKAIDKFIKKIEQ